MSTGAGGTRLTDMEQGECSHQLPVREVAPGLLPGAAALPHLGLQARAAQRADASESPGGFFFPFSFACLLTFYDDNLKHTEKSGDSDIPTT